MQNNLTQKLVSSFNSDGILRTLWKVARYPFYSWDQRERKVVSFDTIEDRFTHIFKTQHWGKQTNLSGRGSTLEFTENLRKHLPDLFAKYSIKSVFDAPCGDFVWMGEVLKSSDIVYAGGDVVRPLVDQLNDRFKTATVSFIHIDLTNGTLPHADLMICRDCLFHLSFAQCRRIFENFAASSIPLLLTTTHIMGPGFKNFDIEAGRFRPIDLFSAPFNLPMDCLENIDDSHPSEPLQRAMALWTRDQVMQALKSPSSQFELKD